MRHPGTSSTAELDALSGIQTAINGVGLQALQGQNTSNLANCQSTACIIANTTSGANQMVNATTQGFAGLNTTVVTGDQSIQNSLCQGFNGVNTAILSSSKDNALSACQATNQIVSSISNCCCDTRAAIAAEGTATRALVSQLDRERMQTEISDLKCKLSAKESEQYTAMAVANLGAQLRQEMQSNTLSIIGHMAVVRPLSSSTPASAAA